MSGASLKLSKLRECMRGIGAQLPSGVPSLGAYIIPTCDAHDSEYVAPRDARREFISGFTGSAGTAVVTPTQALLWTDGRYFLQAETELDSDLWILMKDRLPETVPISEWLSNNVTSPYVGIDPYLISNEMWDKWSKYLKRNGKQLLPVQQNLVDLVRSSVCDEDILSSQNSIFPLEEKFAGESITSKIERVREKMSSKKVDLVIVTALDEVAWLFNLRGSDIDFNPVFFAYAIVSNDETFLFVDAARLNTEASASLIGVRVEPYDDILSNLQKLVSSLGPNRKVWISPQCSHAVASLIHEDTILCDNSPIQSFKAVKNGIEVQHMKNAHLKDGVALCEYIMLLEQKLKSGERVTEVSGAALLDGLRSKQDGFVSLSFPTISSTAGNGAVIHYHPTPETDKELSLNDVYLVDSGGQYLDGTTDVTRTVHFGTPSDFERSCYTRVLKGHIVLATLTIPSGTNGHRIDSFARSFLWQQGLDYQHGTGHGVGMFLNVHEGPQGISFRINPHEEGIVENVVLSNEPGYYHAGKFGIRIESLMVYRKAETANNFGGVTFIVPETITMTPLCVNMILKDLLTPEEIAWINTYHNECLEKLTPLLETQNKSAVLNWLRAATKPL